ncbi:hypothetical protein CAPTEDRAFT_210050 [Capitella teleta]|uniref:YqaJ viral recombinase domain-containing protein n=1 Tax=Capitella teleta TaxID=283909 RepID=R7U0F9_CAPTE|nr:hypothetical protein CAPTEDRAFT_210050 [Capitella teleta]|eukprot:ELT96690.1 hypothetical protein CAPTEDRAFT_210050 [Capitella teleta]
MKERQAILIHADNPFLGCSPDGLIRKDKLLEINCAFSAKNKFLKEEDGKLTLNKAHDYFNQIQGQLMCTGRSACYFYVWSPKNCVLEKIERDVFIAEIVTKLENFFNSFFKGHVIQIIRAKYVEDIRGILSEDYTIKRAERKKNPNWTPCELEALLAGLEKYKDATHGSFKKANGCKTAIAAGAKGCRGDIEDGDLQLSATEDRIVSKLSIMGDTYFQVVILSQESVVFDEKPKPKKAKKEVLDKTRQLKEGASGLKDCLQELAAIISSKCTLKMAETKPVKDLIRDLQTLSKEETALVLEALGQPPLSEAVEQKENSLPQPGQQAQPAQVVGAHSGFPVPRVGVFSGEEGKGKVSFQQWVFEVRGLLQGALYGDEVVLQAVRRSLRSKAADVVLRLGSGAGVDAIMEKMEHILEEFYTARQGARESVAEWACRIEELVAQLERRDALSAGAAHGMLRTKFYSGLSRSQLKSALRYQFDGGESYAKLLVAARFAELEVSSVGSNQVGVESMLNDKLDKVLGEMSSIRKRVERLEVEKLRRVAGAWVMARECLQLHQQVMVTDGLGKVVTTGTREVKIRIKIRAVPPIIFLAALSVC